MTAAAAALLCVSGGTAAVAGKGISETAVYSFANGNDGGFPIGGLAANARGKMFGVTTAGGSGHNGVIFEVDKTSAGWVETPLYSFTGGADGGAPSGRLTVDAGGNVYGTATQGGTGVVGAVFELSPPGSGGNSWTETVLYNFTGNNDGGEPMGNVLLGSDGNIYGTTAGYGQYNYGVVYKLTPNGGSWSESVIHAFQGGSDGEVPRDGLIQDSSGTLYGTTAGFASSYGNVFSLDGDGSNYAVLYTVPGCSGCYTGNGPWQTVSMDAAGALYGTTYADGQSSNGEVFKLTPGGNGQWTASVLYAFPGGAGSQYPYSTVLIGNRGKLYGTSKGIGGQSGFWPGTIWQIKQ